MMRSNGLFASESETFHPARVRLTTPIAPSVVDDMPKCWNSLVPVLDRNPFVKVVGTASNGAEALERAEQLHPDLAVLDICMPVMNGMEATLHLKYEHPDIKILMMTAVAEPGVEEEAYECGADAFTCKSDLHRELDAQIATIFPWPRA